MLFVSNRMQFAAKTVKVEKGKQSNLGNARNINIGNFPWTIFRFTFPGSIFCSTNAFSLCRFALFFVNAALQRRKLFRQQRGCKVGVFPTPFHRPQSFPFGQQSVCPSTFVHLICGAIKFEAQHSDAIFTILIQFVENSHANGLCTYICGCGRMTPKETLAAIFEH